MEGVHHVLQRQVAAIAAPPKLAWLLGVGVRYVLRRFSSTIRGLPEASQQDHGSIIDAISRKDPEAARAAMPQHFVSCQHRELVRSSQRA